MFSLNNCANKMKASRMEVLINKKKFTITGEIQCIIVLGDQIYFFSWGADLLSNCLSNMFFGTHDGTRYHWLFSGKKLQHSL